jgi:glycerol-3-phosphate acyltransferase PlsX
MIRISIDAMGGDHGLETTIPASREVLKSYKDIQLALVGDSGKIESDLDSFEPALRKRISVHHASEIVEMNEHPAYALRKKKDSSMRVAINLVKEGGADACVSAGNTGALMATARFVLRTIPGIDRPAICASLPRLNGYTYVLDLGANVDTPPEILLQFGFMGSQLIDCLGGNQGK